MISERALNRTLLQRQHLLQRVSMPQLTMVEHLLGLQAQDVLPPYLSLLARIEGFDPTELSATLEDKRSVRLLVMRGTIHLLTAGDALTLRPFTQGLLTKQVRTAVWGRQLAESQYDDVVARTRSALAGGPLPANRLGELLAEAYPSSSVSDCVNFAKALTPLVQLPPRGLWRRSGGQVYDTLEAWLGEPMREPDLADIVRRYLRAYGPATPADVTTWSGVTGVRAVFKSLGDELVVLTGPDGKDLWDLAGLDVASEDTPAPVRLLGKYDNLWLAHAGRDRVTKPDARRQWMGVNGGTGATVFVAGWLEGMWWQTPEGSLDVRLMRELTKREQAELDEEVARVERFLRPPA